MSECETVVNMFLYDLKIDALVIKTISEHYLLINLKITVKMTHCTFTWHFIIKLQYFKILRNPLFLNVTKRKTLMVTWDEKGQGILELKNRLVLYCSNIVTNRIVIQCEHFLFISVKLNHCSALVLVPLENTADLHRKMQVNTIRPIHICKRKSDPDALLLTWPLCSPRTTITESHSLFGTMVSSMSCFTSAIKKKKQWVIQQIILTIPITTVLVRGKVITCSS